ncbi:MAG: glycosyltransferase family 2 protein [Chloroflexota bacterium]|nr:glycosyltransferase family 2 protein [Chloroflexota bacterium]
MTRLDATYILPVRVDGEASPEWLAGLSDYLSWLAARLELIVVDGSPAEVFARHHARWAGEVQHVPPDADRLTLNGKVGGVLTGVRLARHERLVIADEDVRYGDPALRRLVGMLDEAEVVRPQNHFLPLPWHARWDTARILLNRTTGGDWPGTLGVRRSVVMAAGGYDGAVLFENLELVRTVKAVGGREILVPDLYVSRRPPEARHFWSQRVRQAYDEFARPLRLAVWLSMLPGVVLLAARRSWLGLGAAMAAAGALAEVGRRRAGGRDVFPASASLMAPLWLLERGLAAWLALGARILLGGVPYRGGILTRAATPSRVLERRHAAVRAEARWSAT